MSLPYRILWIDDSIEWVTSVRDEIEEYLDEKGYSPEIEVVESGDNLLERCTAADLDLIVVDYQLDGDKGDVLIQRLRGAGHFTEIVFYSQSTDLMKLNFPLEGVFRCPRDEAVDRMRLVIGLTLHKMRDLGVVRGLVIATAIDLENMVEGCIARAFGPYGEMLRERVLEHHPPWLDFQKKWQFLCGIVKDRLSALESGPTKSQLEACKGILGTFDREVIAPRNRLAHSKRVEKDGKPALESTTSSRDEIDEAWLAGVRKDCQKHLENLDEIDSLLNEP